MAYSGSYFQDCQIDRNAAKPYAIDEEAAEMVWRLSESIVNEKAAFT
jgi:hypothetical protein